jgi:hypothetical protein
MSEIDDRLWADLIRQPGAELVLATKQPPPERQRARRAPLAVGSLVLLGAGVAAALTLTASTNTPPAYAVAVNANGSVTLTLNELLGASGANEALARFGVRARIAKIEAGCDQTDERAFTPASFSDKQMSLMVESQTDGEGLAGKTWVIHPAAIPQGDTLLITARLVHFEHEVATHDTKPIAIAWSEGLYRGAAPTCLPLR